MKSLFMPKKLGSLHLPNRIFMAPMTRGRASKSGVPTEVMPIYYAQRADAGLIISEAVSISPQGKGWINAPGIYLPEHVEAWKQVTKEVHKKDGRIFMQLWHMGRASHPDFQKGGALPVGPSAIAAEGEARTPTGKKPYVVPRALETEEISSIVSDYVKAAKNAIAAGFDGVEIHGANGYLLDQFVRDGSNLRDDEYGGSLARRWRFPLEVCDRIADAIGAERVGYRISPTGPYNGMNDSDPIQTFSYGAQQLAGIGIAYLHVLEALPGNRFHNPKTPEALPHIRSAFTGFLVANGGYSPEKADEVINAGACDAVAFGTLYISNPDLVYRLENGVKEFNEADVTTYYSSGDKGYTDYPLFKQL